MQTYIGTKIIKAKPIKHDEARELLNHPASHVGNPDGYLVEYEDGYKSWSPKDVFEKAYRVTSGMPFGIAIEALKKGKRVARSGWNGKGMWLVLVKGSEWSFTNGKCDNFSQCPFIAMKTADDKLVPWLASQTDMLADDWMIVE